MKAGTKKVTGGYEGVLRDAKGKIVWSCGHLHRNRDADTHRGTGALPCVIAHAKTMLTFSGGDWACVLDATDHRVPVPARLLRPIHKFHCGMTVGSGWYEHYCGSDEAGSELTIMGWAANGTVAYNRQGGCGALPRAWVEPVWPAGAPQEAIEAFASLPDGLDVPIIHAGTHASILPPVEFRPGSPRVACDETTIPADVLAIQPIQT